jgi:hypothetical protein
LTWSKVYNDD